MTERLYYGDSYLREFRARVLDRSHDGSAVYLDRTAFYPTSGGQPNDTGSLNGTAVVDVIDEGERIAHRLASPVDTVEVDCRVDWSRRFDHMQQHSGQHLLSAVFIEQFGIETCSFHLGEEISTLDLETPAVDMEKVVAAERRANEAVAENRPILVTYEDAVAAGDLRKPSDRAGTLRIVSIQGLDRIACGGTHVRLTGEIGPILIRRLEKIRNTVRVEFLCGGTSRASGARRLQPRHAHRPNVFDFARRNSRARRRATRSHPRGRPPPPQARIRVGPLSGPRALRRDAPRRKWPPSCCPPPRRKGLSTSCAPLAQSFTAQPKAVFIAAIEQPATVLIATSADSGLDAGKTLQPLLAQAGGRGGGSARMAQGSLPTAQALDQIVGSLSN